MTLIEYQRAIQRMETTAPVCEHRDVMRTLNEALSKLPWFPTFSKPSEGYVKSIEPEFKDVDLNQIVKMISLPTGVQSENHRSDCKRDTQSAESKSPRPN